MDSFRLLSAAKTTEVTTPSDVLEKPHDRSAAVETSPLHALSPASKLFSHFVWLARATSVQNSCNFRPLFWLEGGKSNGINGI